MKLPSITGAWSAVFTRKRVTFTGWFLILLPWAAAAAMLGFQDRHWLHSELFFVYPWSLALVGVSILMIADIPTITRRPASKWGRLVLCLAGYIFSAVCLSFVAIALYQLLKGVAAGGLESTPWPDFWAGLFFIFSGLAFLVVTSLFITACCAGSRHRRGKPFAWR